MIWQQLCLDRTAVNWRRGSRTNCWGHLASLSPRCDTQFFCPMLETKSPIRESILRKSLRRPFSGFNLRLRTTIVRSRISCSISRDTCSIGSYDLSAERQTSRSFSRRAMYALAIVRNSRCSARSSDSNNVSGDDSRDLRPPARLRFAFAFMRRVELRHNGKPAGDGSPGGLSIT